MEDCLGLEDCLGVGKYPWDGGLLRGRRAALGRRMLVGRKWCNWLSSLPPVLEHGRASFQHDALPVFLGSLRVEHRRL